MKLTILGAAGVRTPLMIKAIARRQDSIDIDELDLMDIDGEHLELMYSLCRQEQDKFKFKVVKTTDAEIALKNADFVITTFRVGGIESRAVDERIPLNLGVIGQETTGPGGFSMAIRSLPVLWAYVEKMRRLCPDAWLINFANPAGLMAESLQNICGWEHSVGICDGPISPLPIISSIIKVPQKEIFMDYFGLNHLGWTRAITYNHHDYLPELIQMLKAVGGVPGLHINLDTIEALKMLPNEYLYYYYHSREAVQNILKAGVSRGEQLTALNSQLFQNLTQLRKAEEPEKMQACYQAYLAERSSTYMSRESGEAGSNQVEQLMDLAEFTEGYTGVALDLIEGLQGKNPHQMILNIPNQGAIQGMEPKDVVEIPAFVSRNSIRPLAVGQIPDHCLGLMKQIKNYEKLTISAAKERSYAKALQALTLHPLVSDYALAKQILNQYIEKQAAWYPELH
jgi:6-phospho-beta-glucosidase